MIGHIEPSQARLLTAVARAQNTDAVLRVVDESLERAAEARKARQERERADRLEEARRERAREFERLEAEDAIRLADRHRIEAEAVVADENRLQALKEQAKARESDRSGLIVDLIA